MILHHVAQRTGFVVEMPAPLDPKFLCHRDLYVLDETTPPQGLEQRIAETQRHEVLYGLLAKIMIDAVDLPLGEHGADLVVDEIGGRRIVSQRLFEHHARYWRDDTGPGEILADDGEQIGRGRKKEHPHELITAL